MQTNFLSIRIIMVSNFIAATDVYMLYRLSVAEYLVQPIA